MTVHLDQKSFFSYIGFSWIYPTEETLEEDSLRREQAMSTQSPEDSILAEEGALKHSAAVEMKVVAWE
jgi:hypothetical protein